MARVGCFGMSFDPVSYLMGQAAAGGGGGNPNTTTTVTATLANPFDGHFMDAFSTGVLTVADIPFAVTEALDFEFSGVSVRLWATGYAFDGGTEIYSIEYTGYESTDGDLSVFVTIRYRYDLIQDSLTIVYAKRTDIVNGTATVTDLSLYLSFIASTLTIGIHPMP